MKLLLITDIHATYEARQAVLEVPYESQRMKNFLWSGTLTSP
ncbi:MAG: hypothetical protein AB9861_07090 [Methanosarcina sp.]|jgi:hypothetical protein